MNQPELFPRVEIDISKLSDDELYESLHRLAHLSKPSLYRILQDEAIRRFIAECDSPSTPPP